MRPFLLKGEDPYAFEGEDELDLKVLLRDKKQGRLASHSFQFTKAIIFLFGDHMYDFKQD